MCQTASRMHALLAYHGECPPRRPWHRSGGGVTPGSARLRAGEHGIVYVHDLKSAHGTWIDGQRIKEHVPTALKLGKELRFGAPEGGARFRVKGVPARKRKAEGGEGDERAKRFAGQTVRCAHVLLKHAGSRRPASDRDPDGKIIKARPRRARAAARAARGPRPGGGGVSAGAAAGGRRRRAARARRRINCAGTGRTSSVGRRAPPRPGAARARCVTRGRADRLSFGTWRSGSPSAAPTRREATSGISRLERWSRPSPRPPSTSRRAPAPAPAPRPRPPRARARPAPRRPVRGAGGELRGAGRRWPLPPPRTNWTRRVPHPVLIGHAASAQVGEVSGPVSTPSGVHIIKRLE